ncbi:Cullin-associated NEDD8-dissociated protein 1 [Gaertneriomyces sp. JEL0708]|nr:Cullin-associated NEDD8-dissociated protein 1 [Gaertneriomyces sp. JEL0708]
MSHHPSNAYLVANLLEKMTNIDPDFRYMAAADLMNALHTDNFQLEDVNSKKVIAALLKLLDDNNGEVQNVTVKCFAPLVRKVPIKQLEDLSGSLCNLVADKKEQLRDVAGMALKTVILEMPTSLPTAGRIASGLVPKLLSQLNAVGKDVHLDVVDILSEILSRFGQPISSGPEGHSTEQAILKTLFPLLNHSRPAVRKRATTAIGNLVLHLPDDLFEALVEDVRTETMARERSRDYERLRTYIGCLAIMSRSSAQRIGQHMDKIVPEIIRYTEFDDDELRENCLYALDSFLLKCPTEITPHIPAIINLSLTYLKYDPNFDYGEDEDPVAMDVDDQAGSDDDEDAYDDADYSDEDDVSWKVRRASSKLLASVIGTRPELLVELLNDVAPALINQFKEREESVRADVISAFVVLVRQVGIITGLDPSLQIKSTQEPDAKRRRGASGTIDNKSNPDELLRQEVPKISKAVAKQLRERSIQTRQAGFALLRELAKVLNGSLEGELGLFVPVIESSLSAANATTTGKASTNTNLKIEALEFVRTLVGTHRPEIFQPYLARLVPAVVAAARDSFYKVTSEALLTLIALIKVIRPFTSATAVPAPAPSALEFVATIFETVLGKLKAADADLEVKERSIIALGVLISQTGDILPVDPKTILPLLVERLRNELTRITTVRTLRDIAESPLATASSATVDLTPILPDIMADLSSFLRKAQRQLRVASLKTLEVLIRQYGPQLSAEVFPSILSELKPLLADSDLHVLPLGLNVVSTIVQTAPKSQVLPYMKSDIMPHVIQIIYQSPHLVAAGPGLESLLQLWQVIVRVGGPDFFTLSVSALLHPVTTDASASKQALSVVAQSVAALCLSSEQQAPVTVEKFITEIQIGGAENARYVSLLALGEIGRKVDLTSKYPDLHNTLVSLFKASSEEIRQAAAFALGNVTLGNLQHSMPLLLEHVRQGGKTRYLVLVALKEVITRFSHHEASPASTSALRAFAPDLWQQLFIHTEETQEETTRNIIAECLGKLSLSQPGQFLPDLQSRLSSSSPQTRATVVSAIRYTFTARVERENYDDLLRPLIIDFLRLVQDSDLNVRRVSLATLNSAAHNQPHLIRESLGELLPLLYNETIVKQDLIHTVEMGPFKHQVDDGLDARKAAYECMYTLLETCHARVDIFAFLQRVISGLADPSHDIKMLTHLMLQRLTLLSPATVTQKLDDCVDALQATLLTKPKQNAVKQEVEKSNELVRSTARTILALSRLCDPTTSPKFTELLKEIQSPQCPAAEIVASVAAEAQNSSMSGSASGISPMDLS